MDFEVYCDEKLGKIIKSPLWNVNLCVHELSKKKGR